MEDSTHSSIDNPELAHTKPPADDDGLIASAEAKRLAGGISDMTIWRWQQAGIIPSPLKIRGRNYWRRGKFMHALQEAATQSIAPDSGCGRSPHVQK